MRMREVHADGKGDRSVSVVDGENIVSEQKSSLALMFS